MKELRFLLLLLFFFIIKCFVKFKLFKTRLIGKVTALFIIQPPNNLLYWLFKN